MHRLPPTSRRFVGLVLTTLTVGALVTAVPTAGANVIQGRIVNPNPANFTPNVLDGEVYSFVQIGTKIYAAGKFTQVQAAAGGPVLSRSNLFAFDATTGAIDTNFAPTFDNIVKSLAVAPDGNLLVGGYFNAVNGDTTIRKLVKLSPSNGQRVTNFSANANGQVWEIRVTGNRLIVGGRFTSIKNVARERFAVLNATTGAVDLNVNLPVTEPHTSDSVPWVYALDVSPDGSKVVVIGNFMKVDGQSRPQAAMINLATTPATLANWQTDLYAPLCFDWAFDTYMRDVEFSPDGSYFAIASTGGGVTGTLCDTVTRWNTGATGSGLEPEWVDVSGGDTLWGLALTGTAVYVGGHQRWMNNYYGVDFAGPGAVERPGIAALDPANGLPFSWNPGRDKGTAVFDMFATDQGLWVGSDTDRIGGETHRKIAFFPLTGGAVPPVNVPYGLPGDLYNVPLSTCQGVDPSVLFRVNAGGPEVAASDCGPDWLADDSDGAPGAAYRNSGSTTAGPWGQQFSVDATVPESTPSVIFDTERWDPGDAPEMRWSFPVPAGTNLRVRLYLINQYPGTAGVGQRVFDVAVDGQVLNDYDIVAEVGDRVGTMKTFNITSDGTVNIEMSHVVENPLVNGIEIIDRDATPIVPGPIDFLERRPFDGSTVGPASTLNTPGIDWSSTRGAFALEGKLYTGANNGTFSVRSFDGSSVGPAQQIDLHGLTDFNLQSVTGMFYADGRIYYTVQGDPQMYYRYFTPESRIVGSYRFSVPTGAADWSDVRGITLADGTIFFARTDGNLYSMEFSGGSPVPGTQQLVSPATDEDWASRGLFVFDTVVDGDPTVDLTSPTQGATVGGTVNVTATASDAEGITQVAFAVDGASIGVDTNGTNGWSVPWNTTTHAAGAATVSATATDTASKTATDQVSVTVDNSSPGTVLMVVGDPAALIAGETAVRNRLTSGGYTVTVVDDAAVTAAQANGTAFVFISSNVNAAAVGTKLRDVVQPVWTAKPYLFDDMRMTGTGAEVDYGNVSSASIVITAPGHPLAAGLSGTVAVTTANHTKSFGVPGTGADTVATAAGKVTTFVYQAGDTLVGGTTAPGCRLASSVMGNAPTTFTAAGWSLFDAAADYAAGGCTG